jgi:septal ring factor EnvC (AmiA/AmiB activator)
MGYKLSAALLVVIAAMCGLGYWYYTSSQATIMQLTENNAKLDTAVKLNEETISSLQTDYARVNTELASLNEEYQAIRRQNQQLADKLQKIDLESAAVTNPEGIERAVNRGTENAGRCFELLSGAELTEKERTAKNDIAFNKECPWLYDDYKSRGMLDTSKTD